MVVAVFAMHNIVLETDKSVVTLKKIKKEQSSLLVININI